MNKNNLFMPLSSNSSGIQLKSVDAVRSELANAALVSSSVMAFILVGASLLRAVFVGWQDLMFLHIAIFLVALCTVIFHRRFSYNTRAFLVPALFFLSGSAGLYRLGLIGMGIPTLISCCILITIFFGGRFGVGALVATSGAIAIVGAGLIQGKIPQEFDIAAYAVNPFSWLVAVLSSIYFMGLIVAILRRFHTSLADSINTLNKRTLDLEEINDRLKSEITERRRAEDEVRRLRNLLRSIFDSMPSILVGVDKEGKVTEWNRGAENATGLTADLAQGNVLSHVFPQIAGEMDKVWQAIKERRSVKDSKVVNEIGGETRFSDVTVYPLASNGIEGAVIRIDDVTDRVRIEEMMIQSEKMLTVGGLAAGMAHEINNPLAGIIQNAQVLRNRMSGDVSKNRDIAEKCGTTVGAIESYMKERGMFEIIDSIMESGKRAAKIVENMLSFSRKEDARFAPHHLGDLLDKTVELAEKDYDLKKKYDFRHIEVVREYDSSVPPVPCEGSKMQQVFFNILKNGVYAMSEHEGKTDPPRFILRIRKENDMARIEIEDNGPGMDEKTRRRVFEPFFTTKGVGVGTGLGLSVSYFIITENHSGAIAVESAPGKGARFIVRLPLKRNS